MQPIKSNDKEEKILYLFYDFETQQCERLEGDESVKIHVPNLCVIQQVCTYCKDNTNMSERCNYCGVREYIFDKDPVKQFVDLALERKLHFSKTIIIGHNAQGFDCQFIFKYLSERTDLHERPTVIMSGTKIISLEIMHLKFIDSLSYMHMPLSALPKAFGLGELDKSRFPHLFNRPENIDYVGELPPLSDYLPETMNTKERDEFLDWYNEQKRIGYVFKFHNEIREYCRQDVAILRLACLAFERIFIDHGGVNPFVECCTIAGAAMRVYRKKYLKPNTISIIPRGGYRRVTKQSTKALQWLACMENHLGREILHAGRGHEVRLPQGYSVDGFLPPDPSVSHNGTVLQFHGCYWHGCAQCFRINRDGSMKNGDTLDHRYERTLRIRERILQGNYNLIEVWECEFDKAVSENVNLKAIVDEVTPSIRQTPLEPRDGFFGGRTESVVKEWIANGLDETASYIDFCSLYPFICKRGKFPIGVPCIYVGERECLRFLEENIQNISIKVEGLIKCEVIPPQNLYHPVLPVRHRGKLTFPLCRSCLEENAQKECVHENIDDRVFVGTWVSCELKKAIELGYEVRHVYEIWQYETTEYNQITGEGGLFPGFINEFFKLKIMASGFPPECENNDELKEKFLESIEKVEGIKLNKEDMNFNAGLRSVCKLILNSLWGKMAQKENMPQTEVVTESARLVELLISPEIEVQTILFVSDRVLYVNWHYRDEAVDPPLFVNVVVAAYVTAQARMKLFSELHPLGERVLYCDTDSIIYTSCRTSPKYEPSRGSLLGQLTDELSGYGIGSHISQFYSGGPKFYAYEITKGDGGKEYTCKVKGLRLHYKNSQKVNFGSVKSMAIGETPAISLSFDSIQRTKFHDVVTLTETKTCKPVYEKRWFANFNKSYPFGYKNM